MTTGKKQPIQDSEYTLKEYKGLLSTYIKEKQDFMFDVNFSKLENLVINNIKYFCHTKSIRRLLAEADPVFVNLAKVLNDEEVKDIGLSEMCADSTHGWASRLSFTTEVLKYCLRNKRPPNKIHLIIKSLNFEQLLLYVELLNEFGRDASSYELTPFDDTNTKFNCIDIPYINSEILESRSKLRKVINKCTYLNLDSIHDDERNWVKSSSVLEEVIKKSVFHLGGIILSEFITDKKAFDFLLTQASSKNQTLLNKMLYEKGKKITDWRYFNKVTITRTHLDTMFRHDQRLSKKIEIHLSNINLLIFHDFFADKPLSIFKFVDYSYPYYGARTITLERCGFFHEFCQINSSSYPEGDSDMVNRAKTKGNLSLINQFWEEGVRQISKTSAIEIYPISDCGWFEFIKKTKRNLLIGLSILHGWEFEYFLKRCLTKSFVIKNDLSFLPLEKRKLIYNKFTEKIDDIFEEAHLSKYLNLQMNESEIKSLEIKKQVI